MRGLDRPREPHPPRLVNAGLRAVDRAWGAIPLRLRLGKGYTDTLSFLEESERWGEERTAEYQLAMLRQLIEHATRTVPYYRDAFGRAGVSAEDIRDFSDLRLFPTMTKGEMQKDVSRFISNQFEGKPIRAATTSGSTGQALLFYRKNSYSAIEWAFIVNLWRRVGYSASDWRAVMRGPVVQSSSHDKCWEVVHRRREIIFSTYHLNAQYMEDYYRIIRESRCRFLHCHPSSAVIFANYLRQRGLTCPLKGVLAASENLYPHQRRVLEEVFGCRVYSFYGQSEQVSLAGECERSTCYHVQPEYGITEVLDASGSPVVSEGGIGEIVATGFTNRVVPFIRYRTGDYAMVSNRKCECGRSHRLLTRIEGRAHEYLVCSDGRAVSATGLIHGQHYGALSRINSLQIYQEQPGVIEFRIVRLPGYGPTDEADIRAGIARCVGSALRAEFRYVGSLEAGQRGKHKTVVQKLYVPGIHTDVSSTEQRS
jgi:phenylacetate-CoA ligase